MLIITIDVGTTNSRVSIIEQGKILEVRKSRVGIKDVAITGNKDILVAELQRMIEESLIDTGKTMDEVAYFAASGMITSNLGLCEIPHRTGPVSMEDLSQGVVKKSFEELYYKPFYFIPGVINHVLQKDMDSLTELDMMRGEEAESFGIMKLLDIQGPCLIILPGSHTKFVYIGPNNEIEKCHTTMAGELIHAVAKSTILSDSIGVSLVEEVDESYVIQGLKFEETHGLTKTLFCVRLMDTQLETTRNQRANFLAGAVISNDISKALMDELKDKNHKDIYIGGSRPLKDIFKIVLDHKGLMGMNIQVVEDGVTERAPSVGTIEIVGLARQMEKE